MFSQQNRFAADLAILRLFYSVLNAGNIRTALPNFVTIALSSLCVHCVPWKQSQM